MISLNLKRRHLDVDQRAMIGRIGDMRQGDRTDKNLPQNCGKSAKSTATQLNVSTRSVETAKAVRKADPDLAQMLSKARHKAGQRRQDRRKAITSSLASVRPRC